ncbi:anhydro-N-acetylmuramic acid kinase [Amycolatopsis thermophila]|uniref:Anhydro-N-acetylmuramic acid kinase n=1 Tax=Amycolatopsis thermophila TaxID=206084 RepID=A0ABU0EN84_9PSEU|nr:anhydro-N-acetylmuramic acid kinase [Amycolatopsis thermophila]MDQ0376756.1 anhydro-N-acetylmuramic acid kinase [Amycolatopsis thermophila]
MRVVGLISGTSVDGIDVALADLDVSGDEVVLVPLGHSAHPYPDDLRRELLAVLPPSATSVEQVTRLDTRVGQAFAEAAATLADGAELVASLGQTVFHWVGDGRALGSLQLGQPAWIAERTGLPVVADLRARDIAAGGHGAPLAGTLDALWLRDLAPAVALNIGGIANVTVVRPDGVQAFDTGPGNALLDLAAHEVTHGAQHSDLDGAIAARGRVHPQLLDRLLAEPYYAAPPPKSTGKELFHAGYLRAAREGLDVGDEDLLATLTELTAVTIARACAGVTTVIVSGGGADNPSLMRALAAHLPGTRLATSDEFGLPREAKEAYLTALLGWLTWRGVPANLPAATGARGPRLLGSITPGAHALSMPAPHPVTVTRLRVAPHPDQPIGVPDAPS